MRDKVQARTLADGAGVVKSVTACIGAAIE